MLRFFVPGQPVGKGRPKATRQSGFVRMYTPAKTVSYESLVSHAAHVAMGSANLFDGPVSVVLCIRFQTPASWSKKKQALATGGGLWPTTKPDIDNIEKAIFDALNGVVWRDDVQVCQVAKTKRYASAPGVDVTIEALT